MGEFPSRSSLSLNPLFRRRDSRDPGFVPGPLPSWLAGALVFVASGAVLVLEIVGLRLVGPYVGVTLQTSSAVIGMALAAIAYGAWTGGWVADRGNARRLLAPTLLLGAVAVAVTVPLVRYAGNWLRGSAAANVLLLALLALFVPAALLSAVPPLVVKLQLADLRQTGRVVGRMSGVGTLGAITATFVTGFVLVAALPTTVIMLSLAGLLALVGLGMAGTAGVAGMARGRASTALASVGLVGAGLAGFAPAPCDVESAYHCAWVTADATRSSGRVLWLNSGRHSYVDLTDPRHLEFAYTKWIGALVDELAPADVLHVGGGGFTLPRYVAATRPGSDNVVLEVDEELVTLSRARLGLRTGPALRVIIGDARVSVAGQPARSRDMVIGDAFGHLAVPWHLTTLEFVDEVRRVLRPGGLYALNVIDGPRRRFARAEAATVAAAFPHTVVIAPAAALDGRSGSNFVIVGSQAALPLAALAQRLAELAQPAALRNGVEFAGGARILTDDDAPVDQLLDGL